MERYAGISRSRIARIGPAFAPKDPKARKDFIRAVKRAYKGKLPPIFDSLADQVQKDNESGKVRGVTFKERLEDALSGVVRRVKDPELIMPLVYAGAMFLSPPGSDEQLGDPEIQRCITDAAKWWKDRYF